MKIFINKGILKGKRGKSLMKKLPYGISDYERLIENNYYYVDKTKYIEKLEDLAEPYIMFLRPRKFGKTLFTSTLEYYYDINAKDKFEELYGETYIGKNPTNLKNSYHILRFNFSGIDTENEETTMRGFKEKVSISIQRFVNEYKMEFYINPEQTPEGMLNNLFESFKHQKLGQKIYVIIDEYDHFANELLSFNTGKFKELVSKNGKVRKWYEILKEGTESVVDRIFITGVSPITLDSLTSGFNICSDETQDRSFNEMLGFTKEELIKLMNNQEIDNEMQEILLPIMKENYDGYKFNYRAQEKIYNSNMCLYFLNQYTKYKEIPDKLVDVNIASDYSKLSKMLELCRGDKKRKILEKTVSGDGIAVEIVQKFNPVMEFQEEEFTSMLFYLGYLTINGEQAGYTTLTIPNKVMKE
ncbi:MAG: AAA family ATPase, partial [Clostridia bacterium]|nr:AAA family ATPase [Clostridia bacterium]